MRVWKTEIHLVEGEDTSRSSSTIFKSYSLLQAKSVINKARAAEIATGKEKRKLSPVSSYILDELITKYFEDTKGKDVILEKIVIKDTKGYGI